MSVAADRDLCSVKQSLLIPSVQCSVVLFAY